ncbi:response regulator transcription factor [Metabacillus indicus]|uniref:response regulator transcription factor n=1 Tax=Metabacillus indicus TaxID=246786 RepID=UPI003CF140B3
MIDSRVRDYVRETHKIHDFSKKCERMVLGCIRFFPFKRATLFTYSAFSNIGEGLIQAEEGKITSVKWIKEDVRTIPPVYHALKNNKLRLLDLTESNVPFPEKYIQQFDLSTIAVIPISQSNHVIGCVLADQYTGCSQSIHTQLEQLSSYFQEFFTHRPAHRLSRRETEVLQHLANGLCMKEMAHSMNISEYTVRDYLSAVIRKLGVRHRAEAVAEGLRRGIIL